jgi:hypothetical protein
LGKTPQRRIIRHGLEPQGAAQRRREFQQRLDAAPIQLPVSVKQHTGGQLWQGKAPGQKLVGVKRQAALGRLMRHGDKPQPTLSRHTSPPGLRMRNRLDPFGVRNRSSLLLHPKQLFNRAKLNQEMLIHIFGIFCL